MDMYHYHQYFEPHFPSDIPRHVTEYPPRASFPGTAAGFPHPLHSMSAEQQVWLRLVEQRRSDQEFVNSFVNKKQSDKSNDKITIGSYKRQCTEAFKLLQWLRTQRQELEERGSGLTDGQWAETTNAISSVKGQIRDILQKLDEEKATVTELVEKRKKKRRWERRKREQARELDRQAEERRNDLERVIDAWRQKQVEQEQKEKRDRETKREADLVLGEVLRKKCEAQQSLQVLESLAKLRGIRLKARQNTHGFRADPQAIDFFDKTTGDLRRLMENQLNNYDKEEATLRNMLESK